MAMLDPTNYAAQVGEGALIEATFRAHEKPKGAQRLKGARLRHRLDGRQHHSLRKLMANETAKPNVTRRPTGRPANS